MHLIALTNAKPTFFPVGIVLFNLPNAYSGVIYGVIARKSPQVAAMPGRSLLLADKIISGIPRLPCFEFPGRSLLERAYFKRASKVGDRYGVLEVHDRALSS